MATTAPNPEPATAAHAASATPILNKEDENFLQRLVSHKLDHDTNHENDDESPRPPLPPRARTPELTWEWDSDTETYVPDTPITTTIAAAAAAVAGEDSGTATPAVPGREADTKDTATREVDTKEKEGDKKDQKEKETDKEKDKKFSARFARLLSRVKKPKDDTTANTSSNNKLTIPSSPSSPPPVDDTDLAAALASLSPPSTPDPSKDTKDKKKSKNTTDPSSKIPAQIQPLLQQFILILRDLTTGVPTAANDLRTLLTDRDAALAKGFHKLPSPMQKLVRQLPEKITASLGPEVLAAAAEAQGLGAGAAAASAGGMKGAAKMFLPKSLSDLAVTPATVASMFRAIVNALKLKFPAFVGTGALWSVAVFLLLFVLWYCFKRGREVRLAEEAAAAAEAEAIAAGVKEGEAVMPAVMPAGMVMPVAVEVPEVILEEPVAEGEAGERVKVPA